MAVAVALATAPAGAAAAGVRSPTPRCPWLNSAQPIAQRVAEVISQMTISDEITMVEGHGTTNPYVFYMAGLPQLCIPSMGLEDGPSGVADHLTGVTQLPAGVALAATWEPSLATGYGAVIGAEQAGKGASVDLGPTVNIDRDPRWGRSFEAYTEDPFLNSTLATSTINGVQSQGVMAQVKHYDAYNQETNRNTPQDNVIVSDRTLHEIYMPAFEAAVKQAQAASVMCGYSLVNGSFDCQSRYLLTDVLKQMWGFPGFVTSDYGAIHDISAATAGTDMEQPFNTYFGAPLQTAVQNGTIPRAVLNTMVARILTEMFRFNLINQPPTGSTSATVTTPAHVALATKVAQDAATMLKNANSTLPLPRRNGGTVAVIGPAASVAPTDAGGGSAYVIPSQTITPLQGIQAAVGSGTSVVYQQGLPTDDVTARDSVHGTEPRLRADALRRHLYRHADGSRHRYVRARVLKPLYLLHAHLPVARWQATARRPRNTAGERLLGRGEPGGRPDLLAHHQGRVERAELGHAGLPGPRDRISGGSGEIGLQRSGRGL